MRLTTDRSEFDPKQFRREHPMLNSFLVAVAALFVAALLISIAYLCIMLPPPYGPILIVAMLFLLVWFLVYQTQDKD